MNALTPHGGNAANQTMTSREIAELTGKQHKDVLHDIRNMLEKLGLTSADFSADLPDSYGRMQPGFKLDRELTLTLVSGYDIPLRHRVVTRLAELEARPAIDPMQVLSDPAAMRGLLLTYTEKVLTLEHKVETLTPKAEALDRLADAEGTMNLTVAAKALQVQPKKLFGWLREKQWIYRRPGGSGNVAYQDKIQAGCLTHKVTTVQREDGTEKVVEQVLVTGKGLAKLSQAFGCPA